MIPLAPHVFCHVTLAEVDQVMANVRQALANGVLHGLILIGLGRTQCSDDTLILEDDGELSILMARGALDHTNHRLARVQFETEASEADLLDALSTTGVEH